MSAISRHRRVQRRLRDAHRPGPSLRLVHVADPVEGPVNPGRRGGEVLFEVHFSCALGGEQLALLRSQLDMTTHVDHKLPADPNSPALARLDDASSLLLERLTGRDRWVLQARTWGAPDAGTIHAWHVR
ncbi:MAG: hypothetical protein KGL16_04110, partial [Acidobacteriota bacterium]|nr:hypothetical protein [Acidobacteriota bacterium]